MRAADQALVTQWPEPVALIDPSGRVVCQSVALERWLGQHGMSADAWDMAVAALMASLSAGAGDAKAIADVLDVPGRPTVSAQRFAGDVALVLIRVHVAPVGEVRGGEAVRETGRVHALSRLVGGVAHDFNNLLTVILGVTEDLRHSGLGSAADQADLLLLQQAAESASVLTRQLLTFSKDRRSVPSTFPLDAAVQSLQRVLRQMLGEHFELVLDLHARDAHIHMDPSAFDELLINLLDLARSALPRGGTVRITTSRAADAAASGATGGARITLACANMPVAVRQLWRQVASGAVERADIAPRVARLNGLLVDAGGRVGADDDDEALLTMVMPEVQGIPAADEAPAEPRSGGQVVLVVEDDPKLLALVSAVLQKEGDTVVFARTATEALTALDALPALDVLFTDIVLPGGDGTAVAMAARRRFPKARIIYTSGYVEFPQLADPDSLGAHTFVAKPFTASQLRQAVSRTGTPVVR